jgi:hypothetical protein
MPVRLLAAILEPPTIVGIVDVLYELGVLVAGTIVVVVVVPVTARTV